MMNCIITSPSDTIIYTNLVSITLPSISGQLQIYKNHAESFILLKKGSIFFEKQDGEKEKIEIDNSECYIQDNMVTILV